MRAKKKSETPKYLLKMQHTSFQLGSPALRGNTLPVGARGVLSGVGF